MLPNATQQNASGIVYGCKVEVEVAGPGTRTRAVVDFGLAPTSATASTTIAFSGPRTGAILDPDHKVIGRALVPERVLPEALGAANGVAAPMSLPVWIF